MRLCGSLLISSHCINNSAITYSTAPLKSQTADCAEMINHIQAYSNCMSYKMHRSLAFSVAVIH